MTTPISRTFTRTRTALPPTARRPTPSGPSGQAAADVISTLGAQMAANPASARAAHENLSGRDVLSLLG